MAISIHRRIAEELGVREQQVEAAVALLDGGATVPFIARYRKEATGALDDAQLRTLEERLNYLRELEERRAVILNSIREQGKLDAALEAAISAADSKGRLEDIYLPYKPKRRTKAEIAKEAGLEPLADRLLARPENEPQVAAGAFVNAEKQVPDAAAALDGARAILVERFAEDAELIGSLREQMWSSGRLSSRVRQRQERSRRQIQRLFRIRRSLHEVAVAPHPGFVPRREGGGARPRHRARRRLGDADRQQPLRTAHHAPLRHHRPRPPRRSLAHRDSALGLAHQDRGPSLHRSAAATMEHGGTGSSAGVRRQLARSAAGRAGRSRGRRWVSIPASAPA